MNAGAEDIVGLLRAGNPSADALMKMLAPSADRGGRIHAASVIAYAAEANPSDDDLDELFAVARIGYDNAIKGSRMADDWARIGTFFAHWSGRPPTEQMRDSEKSGYGQDQRCIAIFKDPRQSCHAAAGDMNGMSVWVRLSPGGGHASAYNGPNSGIGWGFAAFRALIPCDGSFPQARCAPSPYGAMR